MKIAQIFAAAGLVVASLGVSTAADAQNWQGRDHRDNRNWNDHRDNRHWNDDRGHHNGWNRHHQRCRVEWRHHRRVQICR